MFQKVALIFCKIVLFFRMRIKVIGRENIPSDGGAVLAVNHRTNWDVIIAAVTAGRQIRYMAKAELFKNLFLGKLITACGAFPVKRGKGDVGAIKSALEKLNNGEIVLLFPEGKRLNTVAEEKETRAKPGAVMLAIHSQVPVIPTYISGTFKPFCKITISYGKPIYYNEYANTKLSVDELQVLSDELMAKVRSLRV